MEEFTVRSMTRADIPAAAELERLCFSLPWSEAAFRSAMDSGVTLFMLLCRGGKTLGYAGVQLIDDQGYVTNIAVHPGSRRQGGGKALLRALLTLGQERRLSTLSLEVRASNLPAVALYTAAGFKEAGRRKGFYSRPTEDALIMTYYYSQQTTGKEGTAYENSGH